MKNHIILLLVILVATQAFSQKKEKAATKEKEEQKVKEDPNVKAEPKVKTDPKSLQIDSLSKATVMFSRKVDSLIITSDSLSVQLNSVSKEREKYYGLYTVIKEKVLKHDFDPAKLSQIIDSLAAGRDAKFSGLAATSVSLMDSLTVLKKENLQMKATLGGITAEEAAKNRLVNELRLLKELLDSKVLTQVEFDARKKLLLQKWQ